jgi:hypothetical protein
METDEILKEGTEETVRRMLNRAVASESLSAAVQHKITTELCKAIKITGESLFNASTSLRESTESSVETLNKSIDDFRKSNERTSNALLRLTWVLVFAACVQAFYALILLFKR